jgi:hypothetical protein
MKKIECKMLKLKIKNLYVGFKILTVEWKVVFWYVMPGSLVDPYHVSHDRRKRLLQNRSISWPNYTV